MATFSAKNFNSSQYAHFRPTYSPQLLHLIQRYTNPHMHKIATKAMDLGCGTGQVTRLIAPAFDDVVAVDPSEVMIKQATEEAKTWENGGNAKFFVSKAEEIGSIVEEGSVDLVVSGQAFHWFDHARLWPTLAKVLKPQGTAAFWGYEIFHIEGHPEVTNDLLHFTHDASSLGPYWEQPGVSILSNYYRDLKFPTTPEWNTSRAVRIYCEGPEDGNKALPYIPLLDADGSHLEGVSEYRTDNVTKRFLTWDAMNAYFHTWSGVLTYQNKFPEDKENRGQGKDGDIVDRFVAMLQEKLPEEREGVDVYWPTFIMVINRN